MSEAGPSPSEGGSSADIGRLWRGATPTQRVGLGAFALICIGLIALVASLARRPHYAVLYGNLEQDDAGEVIQKLRDLKVPYRVTGGGTIEAPADRIHELRLDLAAESLPAGGQAGFELFDRSRLGISDFGEKLNFQRALQGELARTIAHLDSVAQARVHLALPPERLYASEQEQPSASVVLKIRGAGRLTPAQVGSIVHLVSGAVGGLAPEAVAVLDTGGRLLSSPEDSETSATGLAAASNHLQLRRDYERQVEHAVQSMLDGVLGPGRAVVRASAVLNFDRVERESETYQPEADGNGVLQSRRETRETYRGLDEALAVGVPGVTSNSAAGAPATLPGASSGALSAPGEARLPGADHYEHSDVTTQYLVSRQRERILQPPGQLKQLSLAVFIDQNVELAEDQDLSSAVAAAAGLDTERGDTVVLTRIPFQPAAAEEEGSKAFAIRDFYHRVGRDLAAIILMLLFLRFVFALWQRSLRLRRGREPSLGTVGPASPQAPGEARLPGEASAAAGPGAAAPAQPPPQVSLDPEGAAAVLKSWLSTEEPGRQASPGSQGLAGGDGDTSRSTAT